MNIGRRVDGNSKTFPIAVAAAATLLLLVIAIVVCTPTQLLYLLLAGLVLAGMVAARSFDNLLVLYIWLISIVHLLKRAIFLLGPQSQFTYYAVLFLPTLVYIPVLLLALRRIGSSWKLASTKFLLAFILVGLIATFFFDPTSTWKARFAAVHERILPMMAFALGLAAPLSSSVFKKVGRAILYSAGVSVVYGVILYLSGPTVLEREWARGTATYSIQGQKVQDFLLGGAAAAEWRGFSYYADPFTWGFFLMAAIAAVLILWSQKSAGLKTRWLVLWLAVLVLGLLVCLTRTPWAGLLVMISIYLMLHWRYAQHSTVLMGIIVAGFAVVVTLGTFLYEQLWPRIPTSSSAIMLRYSEVGTVVARIGAWQQFAEATSLYPVRGAGFATDEFFARPLSLSPDLQWAHNFAVDITVCTGVPGLLLFAGFLFATLKAGVRALKQGAIPMEVVRWTLAFVVGYVFTGYLNGGVFMNTYFFLLTGSLAASGVEHLQTEATWPAAGCAYSSLAKRTWSA